MEKNERGTVIEGTSGGAHVVDGPLTTATLAEASPTLLRNEIDSRIVRIRPMSTPVDQISRMIGARTSKSMIVDYYSVDTKPSTAMLKSVELGNIRGDGSVEVTLITDRDEIFAPTDTLLVPSVEVTTDGGSREPMMLYVSSKGDGIQAVMVNGGEDDVVNLVENLSIVRMGRAAGELDVQTPQFGAVPVKSTNYCQIFKTQIEQSLYAKIAAKEVGWTFSDQEEVAVMDMRMGMEKSFLFGSKARLQSTDTMDEVMLTGGIWNQAGLTHRISEDGFNDAALVGLMRTAFTGEAAGSPRKVLIGGAGFIEKMHGLPYVRSVGARDKVTHWGIDFTEVTSKFGSLFVVYSEVFDQCGHTNDALVLDPAYLTKYVHVPFRVDTIDMVKTGARNTTALVATESSCLVLRHPKAHVKVVIE